jgi:hypothetical protein
MAKGEKISKAKARKWVNSYKKKHEKDKNYLSSILFNKKIVMDMLNEDKCEGLRVYNAMDDEGNLHFILVGTDANGNNILPPSDEYGAKTILDSAAGEPILIDDGDKCPPICPPNDL